MDDRKWDGDPRCCDWCEQEDATIYRNGEAICAPCADRADMESLREALTDAQAMIESYQRQVDGLANDLARLLALQKLADYNRDIMLDRINYRPEDHFNVAQSALKGVAP